MTKIGAGRSPALATTKSTHARIRTVHPDIALFAQTIAFTLLVWFIMRFVWPPLMHAMEARQTMITAALAAAERDRLEFDLAQKEAARRLHQARADAAAVLSHADRRAADLIERVKAGACLEGERVVAAAKAQIEHETARAGEVLRAELSALALAGAERILQRGLDAAAHRKLLADLVTTLMVANRNCI